MREDTLNKQNASVGLLILLVVIVLSGGSYGGAAFGMLLLGLFAAWAVGLWRLSGAVNRLLFRRDL